MELSGLSGEIIFQIERLLKISQMDKLFSVLWNARSGEQDCIHD